MFSNLINNDFLDKIKEIDEKNKIKINLNKTKN